MARQVLGKRPQRSGARQSAQRASRTLPPDDVLDQSDGVSDWPARAH
jgi:hypothetical protein